MAVDGERVDSVSRACASFDTWRLRDDEIVVEQDILAVEEPLEIRLAYGERGSRVRQSVSITMRTPGHDVELAVGFLFTEGIIASPDQVTGVTHCGAGNVACVKLQPGVAVDLARLERHFYTSSSCGVCGKASLEAVQVHPRERCLPEEPMVDAAVIRSLPAKLRAVQEVFEQTGGLHASALFDAKGELLVVREDVGRHNALDKLIGHEFSAQRTPLLQNILLVSGRVSFELVQKAAMAGIPILAAIGAPSSLAMELAQQHGMTIIGFVRDERFNVYAGVERIREAAHELHCLEAGNALKT
jgi:FdhD protein